MRKLIGLILIVGLVAMVAGCGQQTPEIKSSVPQPEGLTIRGTVRGLNQSAVVGDPLEGVVLALSGQSEDKSTTTDSNGDYAFEGLPEGLYIITATKEGYQRNISSSIFLAIKELATTSDNTEVVRNIAMLNTPVILSISPDSGTTVEAAALSITVVFNEAMDPSTVRPTFDCSGIRTFAIADTQSFTTSWTDSKTLVITTGALLANQTYTLDLEPVATATDAAGNKLDANGGTDTGGGGLKTAQYTDVGYRTASGGAPGAPTGLQIIVHGKVVGVTALDYSDASTGLEDITMTWNSPISGQISGYKVYVSECSTGPWLLMGSATMDNLASASVDDVNQILYNDTIVGGTLDPVCMGKAALINNAACVRVVAFNAEGESSAATAEAQDSTGPTLNAVAAYGPDSLFNDYALPAVADNTQAYIAFQEPVNLTSAGTASNYSLDGGANIQSVTLLTSSMVDLTMVFGNDFTVVLIDSDTNISAASGVILTVSGVTDLAGNAVVTGTGDTLTF